MLIVLTGAEGIGRRFIARSIISKLNNFQRNGFNVNFSYDNEGESYITLEKSKKKIVISMKEPLTDEEFQTFVGVDTAQWIDEMYRDVISGHKYSYYLFNTHINIDSDYDISVDENDPRSEKMLDGETDVFKMYNERPEWYKHYVVTGSFSKYYLDELKAVYKDEMIVINIIRQPSVSMLLNDLNLHEDDSDDNVNTDKLKFIESTIASGRLSSVDYVTTIPFEDIINNGGFEIMGQFIELGVGYQAFNDYISHYELEKHTYQDLTTANERLSNYDPTWWDPDLLVEDDEDATDMAAYLAEWREKLPNIFNAFPNYEPLDYEEIISPRPEEV